MRKSENGKLPSNLFIDDKRDMGNYEMLPTGLHATNGTFMYDPKIIVPTVLAGFQYIADTVAQPEDGFLIGVNSAISMALILRDKEKAARAKGDEQEIRAVQAERKNLVNEYERALAVAVPLALQHPDRKVVVSYYNDLTPVEMYKSYARSGV